MQKTLMEMLIEAGYPKEEMYHPSYGSDLYVYVAPLTTKVIEEWCKAHDYRMAWHWIYVLGYSELLIFVDKKLQLLLNRRLFTKQINRKTYGCLIFMIAKKLNQC